MLKVTVEHSDPTEGVTGECEEQDQRSVVFAVNQLEDGVTRSDFYIQKESTLHFNVRSPGGAMQIFVESVDDQTFKLGVESSCTLDAVKIKIPPKEATMNKMFDRLNVSVEHSDTAKDGTGEGQEQESILPGLRNVVFAVNHIQGGVTRSDFNIQKESTLHFNVRSPGGYMRIFVESVDDRTFKLRFESSCAIDAVKIKIPSKNAIEIHPARLMHLTVKTLAGKVYNLDVQPSYTIYRVKSLIEKKHGIPIENIRLIYNGKYLINVLTLEDYFIQDNATLHLLIFLPGGSDGSENPIISNEPEIIEDDFDFVEIEYLDGVKPVQVKK